MKHSQNSIRLIFLSFGLCISSWAPLVPFTKTRLELGDAELGLILLVMGMGALIMMPITGFLINRFGSKIITLLSGIAVMLLLPCLALANTTPVLCLTLFAFGVATGAMNVSMNAQAVDIEIASKSPIMSGIHCWFSIGGLFGALLVSFLLERGFALHHGMMIISILVFFILMFKWRYLLPPAQKQALIEKTKTGFSLPNPAVIFLGILCFIAFMAEGSMLDWSAEYLVSNLQYTPAIAGIGYAIFSIAMALGRFIGDRVVKRLGVLTVFQAGCLLAASGFLFIVGVPYAELIGFFFIGLGASNVVPILFSSSGRLTDVSSNTALSVITTCGYVGLLVGPAFIGFIAEMTSLSLAFAGISFLLTGVGIMGKSTIPASVEPLVS
jgi:predicted MFS family arabinose efflux permease